MDDLERNMTMCLAIMLNRFEILDLDVLHEVTVYWVKYKRKQAKDE